MSREYFHVRASSGTWHVQLVGAPSMPFASLEDALTVAYRIAQDRWGFLGRACGVRVHLPTGEVLERLFGEEGKSE